MPKHQQPTNTELYYKRTKDSIEIKGNPSDVKKLIWFDLITSKLLKAVPFITLLKIPLPHWMSLLWNKVKNLW